MKEGGRKRAELSKEEKAGIAGVMGTGRSLHEQHMEEAGKVHASEQREVGKLNLDNLPFRGGMPVVMKRMKCTNDQTFYGDNKEDCDVLLGREGAVSHTDIYGPAGGKKSRKARKAAKKSRKSAKKSRKSAKKSRKASKKSAKRGRKAAKKSRKAAKKSRKSRK